MKFFKLFLVTAGIMAFFFSCSKTEGPLGNSVGTLKSNDTTGDCLPFIVNGTYTAGVPLIHSDNYIDVNVNITIVGNYTITTDSVNGMIFQGSGRFGLTGINRVRLYGAGKPILSGLTNFNITYEGTTCTVSILVNSSAAGAYTFKDTSTTLRTTVSGVYIAGTVLNSSDSVVVQLLVTKPGSITLTSNSLDGISFTGTGVFTTTGVQSITLGGKGTPLIADSSLNFIILDTLSDTSKFSVRVIPFGGGSPANFRLGNSPNSCGGFIEYGSYAAGVKLSASDSVTTQAIVTKGGPYSIVTAPVNGIVFSTTGTFDSAGTYTVKLKGSGTPLQPGLFNYTATTDSSSCTFSIIYGQGSAIYSLGGSPGQCAGFVQNGTYKTTVPLTAANTVIVQVDVITAGTYSISTPTVDGITFTASGTFSIAGPNQFVTLTGTGIPISPGLTNFSVNTRFGSCLFTINVQSTYAGFSLVNQAYGTCNGFNLSGKYVAKSPVTIADSATVQVNVTDLGIYSLMTDTTDGIIFIGTGIFTKTGTQEVTLYAKGKPAKPGANNFTAMGGGSTCTFSVNVADSGTSTSTFTLGNSPSSCAGFVLNGTYGADTVLTAANTATVQVNVTVPGTYSVSTAAVNGVTFAVAGTFTTTGIQLITLKGSGTPAKAGSFPFKITDETTSSCTFNVDF